MLIIRYRRVGKRNHAQFKIVVAEKSFPIKGKFVEALGSYDPHSKETVLKEDRIKYWLGVGAQCSDSVHNLLISKGLIKGEKIKINIKEKAKEEGEEESANEVKPEVETESNSEESPSEEMKEEKMEVEKTAEEEKPIDAKAEEDKLAAVETKTDKKEKTEEKPKEDSK